MGGGYKVNVSKIKKKIIYFFTILFLGGGGVGEKHLFQMNKKSFSINGTCI